QSAARTAANGARVMQHFVKCDRQRAVVAQHDHAKGVADQDDVDSGFVSESRSRVIVSRQANNLLRWETCSRGFPLQKVGDGNFPVTLTWDNAHGGLRCRSLKAGYSPAPTTNLL